MHTNEPGSLNKLRILLVDDDADYAVSLVRALSKYCSVEYAATEAEALRMLYRESYDVLLLDLTLDMGYLTGFQFLEYLKRLPRFDNLLIIGISGMTRESVKNNPSFDKLSDFFTKPVKYDDVISSIERLLPHAGEARASEENTEIVEDI